VDHAQIDARIPVRDPVAQARAAPQRFCDLGRNYAMLLEPREAVADALRDRPFFVGDKVARDVDARLDREQ
jgi:hypothetical protein